LTQLKLFGSLSRGKDNQRAAKAASMKALGIVGTPDYLAPEILLCLPNSAGSGVDIWGLGICLYEWAVGYPPFSDTTVEYIFKNILDYHQDPIQNGIFDFK
jgi:serine/threonine protein kinase